VTTSGALSGTLLEARATPSQLRLVVAVDGVGELGAVGPLDRPVAVGERVELRVDASRLAPVG
jgi:thiamine transport system ATP-binding protein